MRSSAPPVLVGRRQEVALLGSLVRDVAQGQGHAVWVEGDPGIGKSSLVAACVADAGARGCRVAWAAADEAGLRSPLGLLVDCLQDLAPAARDRGSPRYGVRPVPLTGGFGAGSPLLAAIEGILALVDELCGEAPLVLVADDIQWADEASLIVWERLAAALEQLPLLLVAVGRPPAPDSAVDHLRALVLGGGAAHLVLDPLDEADATALVADLAAPPGPRLRRLVTQAAGNPLYLRELVDTLVQRGDVLITEGEDRQAELTPAASDQVPRSLTDLITHHLDHLSAPTMAMLGAASMMGGPFTAAEVAAVLGCPTATVQPWLREAVAGGILGGERTGFAFVHLVIRQAIHDATPSVLRAALHLQIARVLAPTAAPERVAEHLLAIPSSPDRWSSDWAARHADLLAERAPETAADLLERIAEQAAGDGGEQVERVAAALARTQFRLGRMDSAEKYAQDVLSRTPDLVRAAEMRWLLARVLLASGRGEQARTVIDQELRTAGLPAGWQARFGVLSAVSLRGDAGDLDAAEDAAGRALAIAEAAGDRFALAYALCMLWTIRSVRRRHEDALRLIDRALDVVGDEERFADIRCWAVENRIFTLQNLDRLQEADAARLAAMADAGPAGRSENIPWHIGSAVQDFWNGRWDDAAATLASVAPDSPSVTHFGLREHGQVLLHHGVLALVAGHRDERETVRDHLDRAGRWPLTTVGVWENADFLLAAQALDEERDGSAARALAVLVRLLEVRPGQMTLVHQWLPGMMRLAIDLGDVQTAHRVMDACEVEAAREATPARATAAARRCRALLASDPAPLLAVAEHYAAVGRRFEEAETLEDAAVLLARHGNAKEARAALREATTRYQEMGAVWTMRRADTRLRPYGVRRGVRGPRQRASFGWEALTPTELRVARLVAAGKSNPEVGADLFLSRRTVQTHVSHILAKLGVRSRVEIAMAAQRHDAAPQAGS